MSVKINCRQAVDFISKKEEGKLSAQQRFKLWRHLSECSLCHTFSVQNKIMAQAAVQQETRNLTVAEKEEIVTAVLQPD